MGEGARLDADLFARDPFGCGRRVFVRSGFAQETGIEALPSPGLVVDEQGSSEIPVDDDGLGEFSFFSIRIVWVDYHGLHSAPRSPHGVI